MNWTINLSYQEIGSVKHVPEVHTEQEYMVHFKIALSTVVFIPIYCNELNKVQLSS
jgi:hypothetical protein